MLPKTRSSGKPLQKQLIVFIKFMNIIDGSERAADVWGSVALGLGVDGIEGQTA
jgi:hypothetical protein